MRRTNLFVKTLKEISKEEKSKNAQLLIRAGYVHKVMAGVYAYTPLGLRVLENIKHIVREEMSMVDSQELIMTNLQRKDTWEQTGRWDDESVDVWFKTRLKDDTELGLAWSHEEAIMEMMQQYVKSYKDLPTSVYQFQTKLRNELRAKSGIMRGREFIMKDAYSLHASQEDCDSYYNKVIEAYKKMYKRLGLVESTFVAFASGGSFTKFSHEFQTICDAGEDTMYVNEDQTIAVNEEVLDDATKELGVDKATLRPVKSAEVGNIFKFGTEKSEKMGIHYIDKEGKQQPIYLASYGVGITRVMGVIVEKMSDKKGLVWPKSIAPFQVYLVSIGDEGTKSADGLYTKMKAAGISVLYDDRDERPGNKFADAELMGMPWRVTVSDKTVAAGEHELTDRKNGSTEALSVENIIDKINKLKLN